MTKQQSEELLGHITEMHRQYMSREGLQCEYGARLINGLFEIAKEIDPTVAVHNQQ